MKKTILVLLIIILVVLSAYFSYRPLLSAMANYLIYSRDPEKADVILVLAGDEKGLREEYGAKLYKDGIAKKIIVSGGLVGWRTSFADIMKNHLEYLGVSDKDIILEEKSTSTAENARFCLPIIKKHGFKKIILVTSSYHSRRTNSVFNKYYKSDKISIISCPVPASMDWFKADKWWTRRDDAEIVLQEYFKIIFYFLHE